MYSSREEHQGTGQQRTCLGSQELKKCENQALPSKVPAHSLHL